MVSRKPILSHTSKPRQERNQRFSQRDRLACGNRPLAGQRPEGHMFTDQLRRAVEASPRCELPRVSAALWKAYAAGQIEEGEAQALSDLIEARKALPVAQKPAQRRVGSRPRSHASMERRRSWAASGAIPPQLAARFTLAE